MTSIHEASEHENLAPGVFKLPSKGEPSAVHSQDEITLRQGATGLDPSQDTISPEDSHGSICDSTETDDFPMVVWLRGDEPWFSEFDMDADATMNALSIKRSRLTQIAGKELRVGRVRVDRYIRPVFRSIDVEHYLNQTRATATHQKSSDAINSATTLLCQQIERFEHRLEVINENLLSQVTSVLQNIVTESLKTTHTSVMERHDSLESNLTNRLSVTVQETFIKFSDALSHQMESHTSDLIRTIDSYRNTIESFQRSQDTATKNLALNITNLEENFQRIQNEIRDAEQSLQRNLKAVMSDVAHLKRPEKHQKSNQVSLRGESTSTFRKNLSPKPLRHPRRKPKSTP
jgi:hypothetical protein